MDIKTLSQQHLSEILDNAITTSLSGGGNWKNLFPKISNYTYFIPEYLHDMEEYPDSFRGDDHVVAYATVQYPELYLQIERLIAIIIVKNIALEPFMSTVKEYAGTHYIVELVLKEKKYISLYTDFLLSNEDEHFQCFDFIRIVRQWGWLYETYYLLFARFFLGKDSFNGEMDYLNYSVSSLLSGHFEDEAERNIFFQAVRDYLVKLGFDPSDNDYNESLAIYFKEMVLKHFAPRNFDFAEMMKDRYLGILNNPQPEADKSQESLEIITEDISIQSVDEDDLPEI